MAAGIAALAGIAITWWTYRNTIRIEPLDPQRFARMNDTEQVEWLIKQILARSKRTDWPAQLLEQFSRLRQSGNQSLWFRELELIGIACDEYALPHLLNRTAPYLTDGRTQHTYAEVDHLLIHQALQQAREGDWQGAEQTRSAFSRQTCKRWRLSTWAACKRTWESGNLPSSVSNAPTPC